MEYINPWVHHNEYVNWPAQNWLPWGKAADMAEVEEKMLQASSYKEWKQWAEQLDVLKGWCSFQNCWLIKGNVEWKKDPESDYYDWRLIEERSSALGWVFDLITSHTKQRRFGEKGLSYPCKITQIWVASQPGRVRKCCFVQQSPRWNKEADRKLHCYCRWKLQSGRSLSRDEHKGVSIIRWVLIFSG